MPAQATATIALPPIVSDEAPDFVKRVTAVMLAGKGDLLPVSAFPVDGTWPTGTAHWEKRNLALRDPGLGRGDLHPVQQVRDGLPARGHPRQGLSDPAALAGRAGDLQVDRRSRRRISRATATRSRSRPRTAPAARCASRSARPRTSPTRATRRSTWRRRRRCARPSATTRVLPRAARGRPHARCALDVKGTQFLAAAVRVLRRVRRLRRDAVHQAADAALRRPRADRERHRLLVDLRRQPADHAVLRRTATAAARPGQLAVRGQRRVRPRHAARGRPARASRRASCCARSRRGRRRRSSTRSSAARQHDEAGSRRSASASAVLRGSCKASARPRRARLDRSPTTSCARASGSSAATAGPTTSATAASTTCSRRARTSTSSCSTPRSTPTPAASIEVHADRRGGEVRRGGQGDRRRRTSACWRWPTATSTWRTSPSARRTRRRVKAFAEAEAYPGPSLIIAYCHCIAHGYDLAYGAEQQKLAVETGYWPLYRYDPRRAARREPAQLDSRRAEGRPDRRSCATRRASAWSSSRTRSASRNWWRRRRATSGAARALLRAHGAARRGRARGPHSRPPRSQGRVTHDVVRHRGIFHGPVDPLSRAAARRTRSCPAPRRWWTTSTPCAGSRTPAPPRSSCTRSSRSRSRASDGARSTTSSRTPTPSPRRARSSRARRSSASGPTSTSSRSAASRRRSQVPVIASLNGITAGGWLRYARLIEQAGADALELNVYYVATDPAEDGADGRAAHHRHRPRGQAGGRDPGRREALAVLLVARPLRAPSSKRRAPTALVLFNRFYQPDIDAADARGRAARCTSPIRPSCCCGCAGWRSSRPQRRLDLAVTGGVHTPERRGQGGDGRRERRADGVGAAQARPASTSRTMRDELAHGWQEHEYASLAADARQHEPGALPRPGGVRARQLHAHPAELEGLTTPS